MVQFNVSFRKIFGLISAGTFIYSVAHADKKYVQARSYDYGYRLSQRYKKYEFWDVVVEPIIVKQFGIIFGSGHSFIKGMISDNDKPLDYILDNEINDLIRNSNNSNYLLCYDMINSSRFIRNKCYSDINLFNNYIPDKNDIVKKYILHVKKK